MKKNTKKQYEPMQIRILRFETEDVLFGSGFLGEEEILALTYRINRSSQEKVSNQVNPV